MIIDDCKRQFYNLIESNRGSRVLILVSYDIDAICSCRIIQFLFETDNIQYTIIPIAANDDLLKAYHEHCDSVKYVLLLNLGASIDIIELFEPSNDVTIFIADSHRPIDVCNVYRDDQIRVITFESTHNDETSLLPKYEQLFRDDDDDDDDVHPQRLSLEQLEKRKERKLWSIERKRVLFEYESYSYYSYSTAMIMFDLSWKLSKDNNELLWLGIVGMSDQFNNGRIGKELFEKQCHYFRDASVRLRNIRGDGTVLNVINSDDNTNPHSHSNHLSITYENDLQLSLYRHWSIYESLRHTMFFACKFRIWKLRGHKQMLNFLAKLGLPLIQCKQKFASMDYDIRNNVKEWIIELINDNEDYRRINLTPLLGHTFIASRGFKQKYNAFDVANAARALLESADKDKRQNQKFFDAIDSLSWNNLDILETGFELGKVKLIAILKQIQIIINSRDMSMMHAQFWHVTIPESSPDATLFSYPGCLNILARFLLHAHAASNPKSHRSFELPLVLIAPDPNNPGMGLAIGIPPLASSDSTDCKNFFSKAFDTIRKKVRHFNIELDLVDACVVHLPFNERINFLNELSALISN